MSADMRAKFCEDCRWLRNDSCDAPRNRINIKSRELVRREPRPPSYGYRWQTASFQRSMWWLTAVLFRACGRRARWFEPIAQSETCKLGAYDYQEEEKKMSAELIQDKNDASAYRVEAIVDDGAVEVAIFSGPNALDRAIAFAGNYYDSWGDPGGLAGY